MCDGVVIDAHMALAIRKELAQENGPLYELIMWFISNCGIARTPLIEQHLKEKIRSTDEFFWNWYRDQIEKRSVHDVTPVRLAPDVKRKLRTKYGLPKDVYVIGYLECAHATHAPKYILTEDMYFYEPRAKNQGTESQSQIRAKRSGALCRYLEQELKIRVGTAAHYRYFFPVSERFCSRKAVGGQEGCPKDCLALRRFR